jgi:hypothetical protein
MAEEERVDSTIFGAAGEYYVMCQLLRQNMIAALAPAGVPNADIVVTDKFGSRLCAVQVKVRRERGSDGGWHMGKKHETIVSPSLFYCFVNFWPGISGSAKMLDSSKQCSCTHRSGITQKLARSPGQRWKNKK